MIIVTFNSHSYSSCGVRIVEVMPHYRCCVGGCDNDSRYPEKVLKRGHVTRDLTWHYFPKDPKERAFWVKNISKGLEDFVVSDYKVVCSNHFQFGKPTFSSHVYLVASDKFKHSPRKRKIPTRNNNGNSPSNAPKKCSRFQEAQVECNICFTFEQLTREHDVRFYPGLPSSSAFRLLFEQLSAKAREMHYWRGEKHAQTSHIMTSKVIRTTRVLKFLNSLQPYDEIMADRGSKIHDLLSFHQCFLTIPPSKHTNLQMSSKEVKTTSRIANVRICVEHAIKRIKDFLILKREFPISLLIDDIVIVCSSLSNLNEPLSL